MNLKGPDKQGLAYVHNLVQLICQRWRHLIIKREIIMRLQLTFLFVTIVGVHLSFSAFSQKINIKAENKSLDKLLKEVRIQSGYRILYNTETIKKVGKISVDIADLDLEIALNHLFSGLPLSYEIQGNTILVKPSQSKKVLESVVQQELSGRVIDANGEPLIGVSVQVLQSETGTTTDSNGNFTLTGVAQNARIRLTYVGYVSKEVSISEITSGPITLEQDIAQLEAVTVSAGYGIRQNLQPTGSVVALNEDALEDRSIQTPDQALQARASGVRLINTNGQPGGVTKVVIRGIGSINASTDPLWVIDGVRVEPGFMGGEASMNVLQSLNPEDIESMEVLKDAAATAIYGADGANGVVLITTKRGATGATKFKLSTQFGAATQPFRYDAMDGPSFVTAMQEAYANRYEDLGTTSYGGVDYGDPREAGKHAAIAAFGSPDEVGTYDWQSAMAQTGIQKRVNLSASGGNDKTTFYVSAGWGSQGGTVIKSQFDRMTLHTSFSHKVNDRLSFDLKTNLAANKASGQVDQSGNTGGTNWTNSPFHGGVTVRVTSPIYNPDGSYNQDPDDLVGVMYNMVQVLDLKNQDTRLSQLIGSFSATYQISDHLSFRSRWNLDHRIARDHEFRDPRINRYGAYGGRVIDRTQLVTSWNTDQVFEYRNTFGTLHNLNAILGAEYQRMYRDQHSAEGRQLPSYLFNTIDATAIPYAVGGTWNEYRRAGVFTQFQYDYDKRFFATASLRYDGHSRFGADNRWGAFYSLGLAWDMAKEPFFQNADFLTQLKPRISYGTTGNSGIGNFAARALFGVAGSYDEMVGLRPTQLGNNELTWEAAKAMDIAIDWAMFNGRVYGTFDFFRKDNQRLLLERNLPTNSGFTSIMDNVGTVRNQGFEGEVGVRLLDKGKFKWTSEFNITLLDNEVIDLGGQASIGNEIRLGYPLNIRWGYYTAGVNPADGRPMWYDHEGNLTYNPSETQDRGVIGNPVPNFYGGFFNRFSYGPLALEVLFHYEYGRDLYSVQGDVFYRQPHRGRVLYNEMWGRWQQPGDMTDIPRFYSASSFPGGGSYFPFSTRNMQDGSFIRLKNVRLHYNLPEKWLSKAGIHGLSVFVQAENLATWTAFDGPDPEVIAQTQTYYPQPRVILGGLTLDF